MILITFNPLSRRSHRQGIGSSGQEAGRNAQWLIRKALREWLDKKTLSSPGWPSLVLKWQGASDMEPFESYRDELLPPREDALL